MLTDIEILESLIEFLKKGESVALCTIIEKRGSAPRDLGAKMLVSKSGKIVGTIGGGSMERALVEEALKALKDGKPKKAVFSLHEGESKDAIKTDLICGGELTVFIDVIKPEHRLIIIGAGHIALSLAKLAEVVGFRIVIIDTDEKLANKERFPMVEEILVGDFHEILDKIDAGPQDFVVIVYGEPEYDYLALEKMLKKRPAYVGLLGSKAKVAALVKRLKEAMFTDEGLRMLHAPIGIDIGAQTPEEIAISILAEIIRESKHMSNKISTSSSPQESSHRC